jgi:DNA polymerase III delta prime subunit
MISHHAYLFFGSSLETSHIPSEFKKPSVDVTHVVSDVLTIDEVRTLIIHAGRTPFEGKFRVCVVQAREIANEAQHALLKVLEEPPTHAQFYFVLSRTAMLLPTLRSRFSIEAGGEVEADREVFAVFLKTSLSERLSLIAEKTKEKDTVWIEALVCGFESHSVSLKKESLLRAVLSARIALKSRGASVKMLLEDLALRLEE